MCWVEFDKDTQNRNKDGNDMIKEANIEPHLNIKIKDNLIKIEIAFNAFRKNDIVINLIIFFHGLSPFCN